MRKRNLKILSILMALLIAIFAAACAPQNTNTLDSGANIQSQAKKTPSLESFKADCIQYAETAFGVVPGQDGVNEDSIFLTVAPAFAGFWRADILATPSEEEYDAFMSAFEESEYWNHEWDNIDTELTYEQSANVLKRLMDFCFDKAVENGWTPGNLPDHTDLAKALEELSKASENAETDTPDAPGVPETSGASETSENSAESGTDAETNK